VSSLPGLYDRRAKMASACSVWGKAPAASGVKRLRRLGGKPLRRPGGRLHADRPPDWDNVILYLALRRDRGRLRESIERHWSSDVRHQIRTATGERYP
jgi:hypothetical protein